MICRLCLKNLSSESAIQLFETNETKEETKLIKVISKFLNLEITQHDAYSTNVCSECCDHLEDFNRFSELIQEKQCTLQNHFLTVDCDMLMVTLSSDGDGDGDDDDNNDVKSKRTDENDDQDEKPLDLNKIDLSTIMVTGGDEMAVGADISMPFYAKRNYLATTPEPASALAIEEFSEAKLVESDDDEVPLINLLQKLKTKFKTKKRKHRRHVLRQNYMEKQKQLNRVCRRPDMAKSSSRSNTAAVPALELNDLLERKTKGVSKKNLSLHYEEVIASFMEAKCDLCEFTTLYFTGLRVHFLEVHNREPYMKCCDKIFSRPSKMMDHVRRHLNPDIFKCTICNKSLSSKDYLQTHMETIHYKTETETVSAPSHACSKCDKLFSSQKRLDNHLSKHDNDQLRYDCDLCNKSFANMHRLRRHVQSIHENVYPHVCDICGKKFKFKPSFERHLNEHQGVIAQPMQCSECNVWLKNEHSLRLHAFTHDRVNTKCTSCGKICSSRTALRAHIKYAHRLMVDQPCPFCAKTFKQRRNLEEHMAIHTGLQLYTCPHCPKECRSRSNMYVHVKQRHPEEWLRAKMARSNNPNDRPPTE